MPLILALDISQTSTGWCVWNTEDGLPVAYGANRPPVKARGLDRHRWHVGRLNDIERAHGPFSLVVLEGYPYFLFGAKPGTAKPGRTAHGQGPGNAVFGIAELTGLLKMTIHFKFGLPFANFSPSTIKKYATGYGRASKDQMMAALTQEHGVKVKYDDEADAWWIAQLACDTYEASDADDFTFLSGPRREVVKSIISTNNPEGTFNWETLDYHAKEFGRKKERKPKKRRKKS